jgi:predicted HTH domain antitoxin
MIIEIPDHLLEQSRLTESDLRLEFALRLFEKEVYTMGQAAAFAGLPQFLFQKELAKRNIPVHYGREDYEADKKTLAQIKLP